MKKILFHYQTSSSDTFTQRTISFSKSLVLLLLFVGVLHMGSQAQTTSEPIVYSKADYAGKSLTLKKSSYNVDELRATVGNDVIRSLKVPTGWEVILYEHNFTGKVTVANQDWPDLSTLNAPAVSSLRLRNTAYPVVFSSTDYDGKSLILTNNKYTVDELRATVGNDAIRSLTVPKGYEVILYEHNFTGKVTVANQDWPDLSTLDAPAVSSLRIRNTAYPVVFSSTEYDGKSLILTKDKYTVDELRATVGNDAIRSLTVPKGYEVTLHEHNFTGKTTVANQDWPDLSTLNAPAVSSITIKKLN